MKMSAGYSDAKEAPVEKGSTPKKGSKNNFSMNARQIENGWIVRESWEEGTGEKRQYKEREYYTEENPIED